MPELLEMTLRPVEPEADAPLLHAWVTDPKASFWQMGDADVDAVAAAYRTIAESPTHDALLGFADGAPAFLMERYDPAHDPIGAVYDVRAGDMGMHFLVAPTQTPIHGFTRAVITRVMRRMFEEDGTQRVVVEPDVRNTAVHALNSEVGFVPVATVRLPDKQALLSVCTREDYERAMSR